MCLAGCYDFITTRAWVFAAMLHGFTCADLGTHNVAKGRNKVRFDRFPQGGNSPHLGKYFCGVIKPTADRRSKLSPMKPQLRGAFALQVKTWPMIGENLTERRRGRSTKNEAAGQRTTNHETGRTENRQAMRGASPCCPARQPERL